MSEKVLNILLDKRIDSNNSNEVLDKLNGIINDSDKETVELDANELEYISSAGLRVLLTIRKKSGKTIRIINVSSEVYEIFDVTGFNQLLDVSKKMREISVEGCEIIGSGFCGNVYRIDPETIVKVYENEAADSLEDIENEKRMAKIALVGGIPTAISYDIVKVGNHYGSVFELLKAKSFNSLIVQNTDDAETITKKFVDFLKQIHETEIVNPLLLPAKDKFVKYLDEIKSYLSEGLYSLLKKMVLAIKDSDHVVHGDPQMKNIMMVDGDPMLIDMDTLCSGEPIFDLQALYVTYMAFGEDDPENSMNFLGIKKELATSIWNWILNYYYEDKTEEERGIILDKICVLAYIRFMYIIVTSSLKDGDLGKLQIKHSVEKLNALSEKYKDVNI